MPGSSNDGIAVLVEKNFVKNIKFLIGVDCPFFGKLLYLYMSDGLDMVKVSLATFCESLKVFVLDEDRSKQLKTCFKILDLDRDNKLNIINLLHLYKNIPINTQLG